ncbi:1-(5-phosphoribosyl)-5-[(5-phosphoribosylamino)methylideneamino]imidazole-4-carboxamide isomerase [Pacificimonas flava]|uniref:1-(5-phosphoribosyl)-5-[(5-phosphoribosylamino)methylideneamino] imidazole-4-carboxamide isomerase n=2 Tax=Pacificimonas TaxID=1960290 RepID=A0A219B4C8_9SPHN|nr:MULTISPECIES: 1-(5-phosphoribosyl)-5-[(5-phosphoribosylamino)methylideneamino]imidazole-4-carboxamide isomerase [Pacificimonas]MBZ6377682.1 1-(5-phosphoribosyl)-5-[(5-phosphoribosylamino)methylideneamino]imidazole-4-carboxamide isomerase [Pacificimonas aurantium]OWV32638.1 1-(5-phosphoribosyl)-5-[(5-phosphoribosylamino)methylideneamino]imidazole-4-carboxamide isomerase [Pacificimonas flava]
MPFTVYPAIDVKDRQIVRLSEGEMASATVYGDDPAEQAAMFGKAGAEWLHIVDLNGAVEGKSKNREVIEESINSFPGRVQVGGGVRSRSAIMNWIEAGAKRVVLGTAALKDPDLVKSAAADLPGQIVVAVDARGGFVTTEGWAETSDMPVVDLARRFEDAGVAALLFTDVGRDGLLSGVNIEATKDLAEAVELPVIASGGVAGMDDIRALKKASGSGISGVIVGRAIYTGRLKLKQALAATT